MEMMKYKLYFLKQHEHVCNYFIPFTLYYCIL